ncbi:DUF2110 family protein [Candidatus Pacearchaeota archaeon]|nr:DUF2110 family protein [Candidatus Pacearchaeota archaeon]
MELVLSDRIVDVDVKEGQKEVFEIMKDLASGIHVDLEELKINERGWIRVKFCGEDSELLTELLRRKFGIAPLSFSGIFVGDIFRGFITEINPNCMNVDMGLPSLGYSNGSYSLNRIHAQLLNGLNVPIKDVVNRFSLHRGMPLEVRIVKINKDDNIDLELSDDQINYFKERNRIPMERVIVLGALLKDVLKAIKLAKIGRDIIKTESLSLTIHMLTCKLGTEAAGMIVQIGSFLKRAKLFSSKIEHYGKI